MRTKLFGSTHLYNDVHCSRLPDHASWGSRDTRSSTARTARDGGDNTTTSPSTVQDSPRFRTRGRGARNPSSRGRRKITLSFKRSGNAEVEANNHNHNNNNNDESAKGTRQSSRLQNQTTVHYNEDDSQENEQKEDDEEQQFFPPSSAEPLIHSDDDGNNNNNNNNNNKRRGYREKSAFEDEQKDDDSSVAPSPEALAADSNAPRGRGRKRKSVFQDPLDRASSSDINDPPAKSLRGRGRRQSSSTSSPRHHHHNNKPRAELQDAGFIRNAAATPDSAEDMIYNMRRSSTALKRKRNQLGSSNGLSAAAQIAEEMRRREDVVDSPLPSGLKVERQTRDGATPAEQASDAGSHREGAANKSSSHVDGRERIAAATATMARPSRFQSPSTRGGRVSSRGARGGRGVGRPKGSGIARRRTRGAAARTQEDNSSDIEYDLRSPPPSEATQRLRDRQRELDRAFKKLALSQGLALNILMERSIDRLAADRYAHEKVPEYDQVQQALDRRLEKRQGISCNFYKEQVEQQNRLYAVARERVEQQFRVRGFIFGAVVISEYICSHKIAGFRFAHSG